jgi:hypothetical protein
VLGILFLGWVWAGPGASVRRRVGHTLGAIAIGLCAFEAVTAVAGLGWGWVRNSTAADKAFTFVTPIGGVSRLVSWAAHAVDIQVSVISVRDVLAVVGLVIAGVIGAWLLWRSPRDGVTRNLGLTLLALALLSPILWSWYVTWGLLILAAVATGRLRTALIVIAGVETFFDLASVRGILIGIGHAGVLEDIVLLAALTAIAIVPLNQMHTARRRRGSTPSPGDRPLAGSTALA